MNAGVGTWPCAVRRIPARAAPSVAAADRKARKRAEKVRKELAALNVALTRVR